MWIACSVFFKAGIPHLCMLYTGVFPKGSLTPHVLLITLGLFASLLM